MAIIKMSLKSAMPLLVVVIPCSLVELVAVLLTGSGPLSVIIARNLVTPKRGAQQKIPLLHAVFVLAHHTLLNCLDKSILKCLNCSSLGSTAERCHHSASSVDCPVLISERNRVMENTDFGSSKKMRSPL